jgi:hypothetical protein
LSVTVFCGAAFVPALPAVTAAVLPTGADFFNGAAAFFVGAAALAAGAAFFATGAAIFIGAAALAAGTTLLAGVGFFAGGMSFPSIAFAHATCSRRSESRNFGAVSPARFKTTIIAAIAVLPRPDSSIMSN